MNKFRSHNCSQLSEKDNEKTVWFKAGQRSVVNWLRDLKTRSENNLLGED